jgi:hypothetical protein
MSLKYFLALGGAALLVAGCQSGDINIDPSNADNSNSSVNGNCTQNCSAGGGSSVNDVCASYVNSGGQKIQGVFEAPNCRYSPAFLDAGNNLKVDMTIPALLNGGAHIFEGSVFVGETYRTQAELAAAGITEGGDGPKLTIEAGATLAFTSEKQFIIINRGSQIFAVGRVDAPITFTSLSDVDGTVGPEEVQQWGGIVINGFGITNQCAYNGAVTWVNGAITSDTISLAGECSVDAEGSAGLDESQYGGDNNDDSSGRLEYVVVKHTGATVGNGDELNGISWGAVGRNTIVKNIEMYSVYDDGMEFFGGAVNIDNYLAIYARDDSIDIDEGYSGTITNSLVIQSATDGNNCIEADGIADYSNRALAGTAEINITQGINSRPTINNLTCIISPNGPATATHTPGAGWNLREGLFPTINNALVIGSFGVNDPTSATDNYCVKIDNRSQQAALDGDLVINNAIFACAERTAGQTFPDGTTTEESFLIASGNQFATIPTGTAVNATATADTDLQLLEGTEPVYSIAWLTSLVDGAAPVAGTDPAPRTYLGSNSLGDSTDWTAGWTYGLHPANRGEALWFE